MLHIMGPAEEVLVEVEEVVDGLTEVGLWQWSSRSSSLV